MPAREVETNKSASNSRTIQSFMKESSEQHSTHLETDVSLNINIISRLVDFKY